MQAEKVGIVGYGSFGRLAAQHLGRFAEVLVYSPSLSVESELPKNCNYAKLEDLAAESQAVILAVNLEPLASVLGDIAPHLQPKTLVVDVCSVKIKPVELMKRHLPNEVQILATHPLFGPQSAGPEPDNLAGHKIVLHPVRVENYDLIKQFLRKELRLEVIEKSPDEHDRQMAYVHGLTFFLARGLLQMDLPETDLATPFYKEFLALVEMESHHSRELFETIQQGNPYAADVRREVLEVLGKLDQEISAG